MTKKNFSPACCPGSFCASFLGTVRYLAPHLVLIVVFIIYLVIGALIFSALESSSYAMLTAQEHGKLNKAHQTKLEIIEAFDEMRRNGTEPNFNISQHLDSLIDTVDHPDWKAGRKKTLMDGRGWSFPSAILFALTTITTIGYGDLVPETVGGKIFCVIFCVIGVPFSFYLLADIGQQMAIGFIKIYRKISCTGCLGWAEKRKERDARVYGLQAKRRRVHGVKSAPNVTMRHMQSVRFTPSGSGDTNSSKLKLQRISAPLASSPPLRDDAVEMRVIEGTPPVDRKFNTNNSGLDQTSPSDCGYDTSVATISDVCKSYENYSSQKELQGGDSANMSTMYYMYESHDKMNKPHRTTSNGRDMKEKNQKLSNQTSLPGGAPGGTTSDDNHGYHADDIPAWLVFLVLCGYMLISAFAFRVVEGWDMGTAAYFTFITLTTIGFGDTVPEEQYTDARFFFCVIFTVVGLAVTSMCIALAQERSSKHAKRVYEYIDQKINGEEKNPPVGDEEQGHQQG